MFCLKRGSDYVHSKRSLERFKSSRLNTYAQLRHKWMTSCKLPSNERSKIITSAKCPGRKLTTNDITAINVFPPQMHIALYDKCFNAVGCLIHSLFLFILCWSRKRRNNDVTRKIAFNGERTRTEEKFVKTYFPTNRFFLHLAESFLLIEFTFIFRFSFLVGRHTGRRESLCLCFNLPSLLT